MSGRIQRQKERPDGRNDAEPQRTRERVLRRKRDIDQILGVFQDRPGPFGDLGADAGRRDGTARAVEQRDAKRLLQVLDRRAESRLADETGLGRLTEMAAVGERNQESELAKGREGFHRLPFDRLSRSTQSFLWAFADCCSAVYPFGLLAAKAGRPGRPNKPTIR